MANLKLLSGLIFNQPHLITPEYAETILAVLGDRLDGVDTEGMRIHSEEAEKREPNIMGRGTSVIPIIGSMTHRASWIDAMSGIQSYGEIRNQIAQSLDDYQVKSILLEFDSPGGMVAGCFDLRDYIMDVRGKKPIYALSRDSMCSAAYLLGSACDKVLTTQTGKVGSIGVVAMHMDQSERNKQAGVKPTFIHAGKYKVAGNPHAPLKGEALEYLQDSVMQSYDMFVNAVAEARGMDEEVIRATEARVYGGERAVSEGLADKVTSFEEALEELASSDPKVYQSYSVQGKKMESEQMEKLTADLTEAQAEVARLRQNLETIQGQVLAEGYTITSEGIQRKAEEEMIEVAGQMVPKASLPEVVVTALETAAAEKADAALTAKATTELPNFKVDVAKSLVAQFGDNAEVMQALKSADKVYADKMEEKGHKANEVDMTDPKEAFEKMVSEHSKAHNKTYHQSYEAVANSTDGKALLKQFYFKKD